MPTYTDYGDDDDEFDADDSVGGEHLRSSELPDEADTDDADSPDTAPCPYCGKPVYELGDVCPHCHSFVSLAAPPRGHPRWVLVVALVCLGVVLFGWLFYGIVGL